LGHVALEDVQVGAADRDRVDPHDRVGLGCKRRIWNGLPEALPGTVKDECLHLKPPLRRSKTRLWRARRHRSRRGFALRSSTDERRARSRGPSETRLAKLSAGWAEHGALPGRVSLRRLVEGQLVERRQRVVESAAGSMSV